MAYIISNKELPNFKERFAEFYINWNSEDYRILKTDNEFLLMEGLVFDLEKNEVAETEEILKLLIEIRDTDRVLPEFITGQFNIILIKDGKIDLINDFLGVLPLFYSFEKGRKLITNTLYSCVLFDIPFDDMGILQAFIKPTFTAFNSRTYFKGVHQLRSGEYLSFDSSGNLKGSKIDSIPDLNRRIKKEDYAEIVEMLIRNASVYQTAYEEILLPISGGVDSRVTLSSFTSKDKIKTISYGETDYIDNRIAKRLAEHLKLSHTDASFLNHLFPTVEEHKEQIQYGAEYFIDSWFSILEYIRKTGYISPDASVILLGDAFDILRAHSIMSLRNRKTRMRFQLSKIFGAKMKVQPYDRSLFRDQLIKEGIESLDDLFNDYPQFKQEFNYDRTRFIEVFQDDLDHFIDFLEKKTPLQNQLNLEEMYYTFTLKRQTTTRQYKIFKGRFNAFTAIGNRHLTKKLFGFHPADRFEEALTSRLFKVKKFKELAEFPTAQIPFVPYKSNLYLKYLVWAFRSLYDQWRIKRGKGRLVKHIEWKRHYENPVNRELLENLLSDVDPDLKKLPLDLFDKRASGEAWPYIEADIVQYVFLMKLKQLKKEQLTDFYVSHYEEDKDLSRDL